jgi:DNA-binding NtrC family response regulator
MSKRALIIDDEQPLLDIIEEVLSSMDIDCVKSKSGQEAISKANGINSFDLILIDMNMPEMNGKDAYKELQKTNPKSAVVFMSGYDISDKISEMRLNCPNTFLKKPFSIVQLVEIVQTLVH